MTRQEELTQAVRMYKEGVVVTQILSKFPEIGKGNLYYALKKAKVAPRRKRSKIDWKKLQEEIN